MYVHIGSTAELPQYLRTHCTEADDRDAKRLVTGSVHATHTPNARRWASRIAACIFRLVIASPTR
ncbi:hypothetical protein JD82_00534 [Prauserella rugosa]|uniref:Uncharacterized protein n=1 Tax=Prauserella rugosa TaxID=43354 RepID=A0A660CAE6_9PSEU|nr:hypothetical protein JD82_00534 [Prauserella rugosa]